MLGPKTETWEWILTNFFPGIGMGTLYSSLVYGILTSAEDEDAAYMASMYVFSRAFGQSIGVVAEVYVYLTVISII